MEDGWEAGGIRAGIRTWENSLPQMPGLAHEWALLFSQEGCACEDD